METKKILIDESKELLRNDTKLKGFNKKIKRKEGICLELFNCEMKISR